MSAGWMDKFLYRLSRKGEIPWLTLAKGKLVGTVTVLVYDPDGKILMARGTAVPAGTAGYAKGCMFFKTDAGAGVQALYENIGTTSVCNFSLVGSIVPAEIALADGKILIGGGAGVATAQTMGTDATITNTGALTIANDAVNNNKLANMATGTVKVGGAANAPTDLALAAGSLLAGNSAGAGPAALALAINQSVRLNAAGTDLEAFTIARKALLTGGATALQTVAVAAGDIVTASATDIAVVSIAAGSVVVGGTGPAIAGVALATGSILKGATGLTPVAQAIGAKQILYYNSVGSDLTTLSLAAGDLLTANATDLAVVSIAAGSLVVGATGPVIGGLVLDTGTIVVGNTGLTPSAITLAVNETFYRAAGGNIAALALGRKQLLTGGATQLQAVTIGNGAIVTIDANDIVGLSIPAKSLPYTSSATGLLAALSVAEGSIVIGGAADVTTLDGKGDAKILIGNGTTMTSQSITGDITITNGGLVAIASGVIVNDDVNAAAAIDGSKIHPLFNHYVGLYGSEQTNGTAGDVQYTAANLLGLVILRDPNGGNRNDTLPDADDLVAGITGAYVGMAFYITIHNNADAAETIQIGAGANCDLHPATPGTIAQNKSQTYLIILENVTSGTEEYAAYLVTAV